MNVSAQELVCQPVFQLCVMFKRAGLNERVDGVRNLKAISDYSFVHFERYEEVRAAGDKMRNFLLEEYVAGKISTEFLCTVAFWHQSSGGCGMDEYAMSPDRISSSNFSEKVDMLVAREFKSPNLLYVKTPMYDKVQAKRIVCEIPVRPSHECLAESFSDVEETGEDQGPQLWGQLYTTNPAVVEAKSAGLPWTRIRPLAIYLDATKYTTRDSFVGLFVHDLRSGIRFLFSVFRVGIHVS